MKKRNLIGIIIASVFTLMFILPSAWAESPRDYRWDGVAIGAGAAVVGSVLLNDYWYAHPSARVVYRYAYPPCRRYYTPYRHLGYWELRRREGWHHRFREWNLRRYHHHGRWVR